MAKTQKRATSKAGAKASPAAAAATSRTSSAHVKEKSKKGGTVGVCCRNTFSRLLWMATVLALALLTMNVATGFGFLGGNNALANFRFDELPPVPPGISTAAMRNIELERVKAMKAGRMSDKAKGEENLDFGDLHEDEEPERPFSWIRTALIWFSVIAAYVLYSIYKWVSGRIVKLLSTPRKGSPSGLPVAESPVTRRQTAPTGQKRISRNQSSDSLNRSSPENTSPRKKKLDTRKGASTVLKSSRLQSMSKEQEPEVVVHRQEEPDIMQTYPGPTYTSYNSYDSSSYGVEHYDGQFPSQNAHYDYPQYDNTTYGTYDNQYAQYGPQYGYHQPY